MIPPLRKRKLTGEPYERVPETTVQLNELVGLSRDELLRRCSLPAGDQYHVRTECLLYFVRTTRMDNRDDFFDRLYKLLLQRVLRRLPRAERSGGRTEAYGAGESRDRMMHRFLAMLSEDHAAYSEKLDFFEVRFDSALSRLRIDAERKVWRDEKRSTGLSFDEGSGEPSREVEKAAGEYDPFRVSENSSVDYRLRLDAAIDVLPVEQIRIIEMLRKEMPIDSKDPNTVTIARTLGKSEKTIRLWRDKAYATLRHILTEGDDQ